MGYSTWQVDRETVRKYYKVDKVHSASLVDYFYKLPSYKNVIKADRSDKETKDIIYTLGNGDFIEVEQ